MAFNMQFTSEDERDFDEIAKRFDVIDRLSKDVIAGLYPSLIVSGPAGLGKSHTIEKNLKAADPYGARTRTVKGYVRPPRLFALLYEMRNEGSVLCLDDADSATDDVTSLNILKAALDSKKTRRIDYQSSALIKDSTNRRVPHSFEFAGSVIFITNIDFNERIKRENKMSPHFEALRSRSMYVSLDVATPRQKLLRILDVVSQSGMLEKEGLNVYEQDEVLNFIHDNVDRMIELSLRETIKIAQLRVNHPDSWRDFAEITCLDPVGVDTDAKVW